MKNRFYKKWLIQNFNRCEYSKGIYEKWEKNTNIYLESSFIEESNASVSYVEKCICPEGYMGLSCEVILLI